MRIEVEVRSFLSKKQYEALDLFFQENAEFVAEDIQETVYLEAPLDLRIQKNNNGVKIWTKGGKIHDSAREEIELFCRTEDYHSALLLFKKLGFPPYISWWRKRRMYNWRKVVVALDYTRHYGYILELEKIVTNNRNKALISLSALMAELNIVPTPQEVFNTHYETYIKKHQLNGR